MSAGGLGVALEKAMVPISTVGFTLSRGDESITGYMHCRWKNIGPKTKAGFEFDSITKQDLAKNELFKSWIKIQ